MSECPLYCPVNVALGHPIGRRRENLSNRLSRTEPRRRRKPADLSSALGLKAKRGRTQCYPAAIADLQNLESATKPEVAESWRFDENSAITSTAPGTTVEVGAHAPVGPDPIRLCDSERQIS